MRRISVFVILTAALSLALAAPAWAGETVEGDGYEIRLPAGFSEAMSIENSGSLRVTSRFGNLPIEGMPEMKAFIAGGKAAPTGMIMLARVNLSRPVTTANELGLNQIEKLKEQLPDGVDIRASKVAGHDAIEMTLRQEAFNGERTARVASIAAGDYVVVVMLETSDDAFPDSTAMWSSMLTSLKVEPGMNKILLFGLLGAGGMLGLYFLGRVRSRPTRDMPDYTGRFKRHDSTETGPGFPPRQTAETGHRPQVLPTRPTVDRPGVGSSSSGARPASFSSDGAQAPIRTPTSPAVTRPPIASPNQRPGLRRTRGDSGRWGE